MSFTEKLVESLANQSFADCSATVVGYGYMGKEYVKALRALRVPSIRVSSRSTPFLAEESGFAEAEGFLGGFENLKLQARPDELAVIATPTHCLVAAARHLRELGYKKFLIEKPLSLYSDEIKNFMKDFKSEAVDVACAYNRIAYPSLLELRERVSQERGITSCAYSFTEFTNRIDPKDYTPEEALRWGIANSLHVISMAHSLIGFPKEWSGYQSGRGVSWHPAGSIFNGAGITDKNIPFTYHSDWGSTGRWSVEVNTKEASYSLAPLEKLFRRASFKEPWQEIPLQFFNETVKVGIVEEVAAMLKPILRKEIPLLSLEETFQLTKFGEKIFGYVR